MHVIEPEEELALALELADVADAITLAQFESRDFVVETKPDRTFVTDADRAAELEIRDRLGNHRPHHVVSGEEYGEVTDGTHRWIVDPIDGTANYLRGVPVWATLIALEAHGDLVVAVVSAPALGQRWWASRGGGAFMKRGRGHATALSVSGIASMGDAHVLTSGDTDMLALEPGYGRLRDRAWRTRGFGDFWQHMLVAEGAAEVAIDPVGLQEYDLAAPRLVVEEAGGRFSDLAGVSTACGGSAVSSNGLVHDEVLAILGAT